MGGVGETPIEGVKEPVLRFGGRGIEDVTDVRLGGLGLEGEEEDAEAGGLEGGIGDRAIMLVDHVLKVLIGGDGDEGVEVLVGELILEDEGVAMEEGFGEVGREGLE